MRKQDAKDVEDMFGTVAKTMEKIAEQIVILKEKVYDLEHGYPVGTTKRKNEPKGE